MTAARPDAVVIGAGIIGAACAYYLSRAGLRVTVLDRGAVAGGTTGAGEGNVLVSDKPPGPELDLALRSRSLWLSLAATLGAERMELETKGALMVSAGAEEQSALKALGAVQRECGVAVIEVPPGALSEYEPQLAADLAGGAYYPQDMQVQPALAAAHLLRASGCELRLGVEVTSVDSLDAPIVVNAAGVHGGDVAALAGTELPVAPRRGFVLVTGRMPPLIRHKVYAAGYVGDVGSSDAGLHTSPVVEGTKAGTILIGSSRERVGFDGTMSLPVLRRLAAAAVRLFPVLREVPVIRAYRGFRPYTPDHLPIIGADPQVPGLFHACGHEGAGIGLAPATGELIAALATGATPALDPLPFRADRFAGGEHGNF